MWGGGPRGCVEEVADGKWWWWWGRIGGKEDVGGGDVGPGFFGWRSEGGWGGGWGEIFCWEGGLVQGSGVAMGWGLEGHG